MVTRIRPCAQAHDMPAASHDDDDDKASCASAQHAGRVARRGTTIRPRVQAHDMPVASHGGDNDKALCASARHISHCAQAHMLRVKHRRNNQPGNVKHRRARATSSNIDNLVRKRTGLSSIVGKRTSFQPSCASTRATASAIGLHKLFSCPVRPLDQQQEQSIDNQLDRLITMIINMLS